MKLELQNLQTILQNRLLSLENSGLKEQNFIHSNTLETLFKHLGLNAELLPLANEILNKAPRTKIIWLHLCECTGCSESLLRTEIPSFDEFIFDIFSLEYHETLMAANGTKAEELLEQTLEDEFILAVEGGVAAIDTFFLTIGAQGESGYEILTKLAAKAKAIFAIGTCSSYGGIQAAHPNPSKTCGISEVLSQKVVNIPGCPPSDINIIGTLFFFALFKTLPELDEQNRPLWAYGKCLHDLCERKAKFESGIFAQHFGDEAAKKGACLFKIGCKGPYTYNNCPKVKFNSKTSWPVAAGHGCIACSEKDFWDDFGHYESPMNNTFAYTRFKHSKIASLENKNCEFKDLKESLSNDEIVLHLKEQTQIYIKDQNQLTPLLELEFESNPKLVLANLSKNKLGLTLVQNYAKSFTKNYTFLQETFDDESVISSDIWKFFELIFMFAKGEFLKDKNEFLNLAQNYAFKHVSPFDFKLNLNETKAKLELSKASRMPLIYLCGGLDLQGLAFSVLKTFGQNVLKICDQFKDKKLCLNVDEKLNLEFLNEILKKS